MLDLVEMMTHMRDIVSDQRTQCDRFSSTSGPGFEAAITSSIARSSSVARSTRRTSSEASDSSMHEGKDGHNRHCGSAPCSHS